MNYLNIKTQLFLVLFASLLFQGCQTMAEPELVNSETKPQSLITDITEMPEEDVSEYEQIGLVFMREEEKLARDVYIALNLKWNMRVFANISGSEQKHMDAIKSLLDKYGIEDPVGDDSIGVFENEDLQYLYDSLTVKGSESVIDALYIGALIEEIDILDLKRELSENVDSEDIKFVYENLLNASNNHLRAFVRNISRLGIEYEPQLLDYEEYLEIINN